LLQKQHLSRLIGGFETECSCYDPNALALPQ